MRYRDGKRVQRVWWAGALLLLIGYRMANPPKRESIDSIDPVDPIDEAQETVVSCAVQRFT